MSNFTSCSIHLCSEGATSRITRWSVLLPCNSQIKSNMFPLTQRNPKVHIKMALSIVPRTLLLCLSPSRLSPLTHCARHSFSTCVPHTFQGSNTFSVSRFPPSIFRNTPNLRMMNFDYITFSDSALPSDVCVSSPQLQVLSCRACNLTGIAEHLSGCTELQLLDLSNNRLTGGYG